MRGRLGKVVCKVSGFVAQVLNRMRLAQKLMLIFSVVLGITIIVFAVQLISVANRSTEVAFIKDTQQLLKESRYDIENKIDISYRVFSSLTIDYDIMSYLKDWDGSDNSSIFDFNMSLSKKVERILFLSPDIYQFRIFIGNDKFPEIGSIIYKEDRLANKETLLRELSNRPSGYWLINHAEDNYNTSIIERRQVVSLYTLLRYSNGTVLGIVEVAMPTATFFRHMFSQPENKNLLACVIGPDNGVIYNAKSEFMTKYSLDKGGLERLCGGLDIRKGSGSVPVAINGIGMNLVYDNVEEIGCTICYIVTNDNITQSLENTTVLIILESILSLVLLSMFIYILTRIILKKMKQIIASMRKVEEGVLDIRVDTSGQDEMSEMAYHFNRMLGKLSDLISEVIKKQEAKKNAEIRALFAQINSHFIINILEDIRMLAEVDSKFEIADAITSLGKLLRYGLKWSREYATLKEEIEYIKNYIALVNIRYDFRIDLTVEVPLELMDYKVLKVSLQPVVENAVHWGIQPLERDGLLMIHGSSDKRFTRIEITDNGQGMDEERLGRLRQSITSEDTDEVPERRGNGIGLRNVNERIRLVYGAEYGIEIDSQSGEYTKVTLRLPPRESSGGG